MNRILMGLIKAYQYIVSPLLGSHCRFYPSCSAYALQALQDYPTLHALGLICKRLLRCHPFCEGGVDPLPEPTKKHG